MHIFIEKKRNIIFKLFDLIRDKWEVYLPLEGGNKFILLKTVCSKCGNEWYIDEKECFLCKARYLRVIRCHHCGKIIAEENIRHCPYCKGDVKDKGCLNCKKGSEGQFVPITFCSKCGCRENKFLWKFVSF